MPVRQQLKETYKEVFAQHKHFIKQQIAEFSVVLVNQTTVILEKFVRKIFDFLMFMLNIFVS